MNPKKRVLFVDDEPLILESLRRTQRLFRNEWDMEFADSGPRALQILAQRPADVVVADLRMPGMGGAELLAEVMKRFPKAARIILSGSADRDVVLKSTHTAHQFLAKPCGGQELQDALRHALAAADSLGTDRIKTVVARLERVPKIPEAYQAVVDALEDPDVTMETVGAAVARDPETTAGVLKMANSAFFGLRQPITDPGEAASFLGLDMLKSMVLAVGSFAQFGPGEIDGFSRSAVWHHSLAVATAARAIARAEKAPSRTAEACFTAGLLHDIGKLILADNCALDFCAALGLARTTGLAPHLAEERVFGSNHAEIAGSVLHLWGLPEDIVEAIALHHAPGRSTERGFTPLAAVHAADILVHQQAGAETAASPLEPDTRFLETAGLLAKWDSWRDGAHAALRGED